MHNVKLRSLCILCIYKAVIHCLDTSKVTMPLPAPHTEDPLRDETATHLKNETTLIGYRRRTHLEEARGVRPNSKVSTSRLDVHRLMLDQGSLTNSIKM